MPDTRQMRLDGGPRIGNESLMTLALRSHFHAPEWVLLPQVRNAAGFSATRTADALAMSVWPSRGLHMYGIEIKVSRGDWLRELKNPKKSDDIAQFCDFWFIAAGHESVVADGELPPGWGLLVPGKKPNSLKVAAAPAKIEAVQPISRHFLAAILKKTFESHVPTGEVEAEIERRVAEKVDELKKSIEDRVLKDLDRDNLLKRNAELEAMAKAYEEAAGVWMGHDAGRAKRYGRALKVLDWKGIDGVFRDTASLMERHLAEIKKIHAALPSGEQED
jgi:hypothetical protein